MQGNILIKKSLRSTKVDERKCRDEIGVSSLSNVYCFATKTSGATFTTNAIIPGVKIVP
jgi:hypothetical protein